MSSSSLNDDFSDGQSVGIIVGIASVVALLSICGLVGLMVCRRWFYKRSLRRRLTDLDFTYSPTRDQAPGQYMYTYNTDNGVHATPSPPTEAAQAPPPSYTEAEVRAQKRRTQLGVREFPRGDLLMMDFLGEGDYGPLYKGEAYGLGIKQQSRPVTVKMLHTQATEATRIRFEQDIALLSSMNHLNVVGLLAVCTEDSPECLLLDAGQDLHEYICQKRVAIFDQQALNRASSVQLLAQQSLELLKIADEICLGMAYLASQQYVHKDLALRNCIRGQDGVAKVANFGLGPAIYPHCYCLVEDNPAPIRWMSPEALSTGHYTTANDQWAFGVLMWELFTYGELPYADKSNDEVIRFVAQEFGRLSQPEKCVEDVYLVMSSCWELEGGSRPNFLVLHEHLFEVIGEIEQKA